MEKAPLYFCRFCLLILYAATISAAYIAIGSIVAHFTFRYFFTLNSFFNAVSVVTAITMIPVAIYSLYTWRKGGSMPAFYMTTGEAGGSQKLFVH